MLPCRNACVSNRHGSPPAQRLGAEENWFRALARVRLWGKGGSA